MENIPKFLWGECLNWANYIKNRLPHKTLNGITPYEALFGKKPTIAHLRPFYHHCLVLIPEQARGAGSKLEPRSVQGHLVGYTESNKVFRIYDPVKWTIMIQR